MANAQRQGVTMNMMQGTNYSEFSDEQKRWEAKFIEDCASATVVDTFNGDALLIGKHVIGVTGINSNFARLIAVALRSGKSDE